MSTLNVEPHWAVGVDTGGTFTDLIAVENATGRTYVTKVPSTPQICNFRW